MEDIQKNIAAQKSLEIEKDNGEVLGAEKTVDVKDQSEKPSQEDNNDSSK